jgi:hypothetical protein
MGGVGKQILGGPVQLFAYADVTLSLQKSEGSRVKAERVKSTREKSIVFFPATKGNTPPSD